MTFEDGSSGKTYRYERGEVASPAERFLRMPRCGPGCEVGIDGAVIEMKGRNPFFDIASFLAARDWSLSAQKGTRPWHGAYTRNDQALHISSTSGAADVVLQLGNRRMVAECKGGPLEKRHGSPEYRILRQYSGRH